jgi:type VI secretion system Hcp family effector
VTVRIWTVLVAAATAALAISAIPAAALAAVNAYLQIPGVDGESTDNAHKGWIEVASFQWSASRGMSAGSASSGAGAGKASVGEIVITKQTDSASPKLFQAATSGRHFNQVVLEMRKAGGQAYETYVLSDVMVASVRASSGGDRPMESITLDFARMETKSSNAMDSRGAVTAPMGEARHPGG